MLNRKLGPACAIAACLAAAIASASFEVEVNPGTAPVGRGLPLIINGRETNWDTVAVFVMPGETLALEVPPDEPGTGWIAHGGTLVESGPGRSEWIAPEAAGRYRLVAVCGASVKELNAFVKVPRAQVRNGELNGYRLGNYPKTNPFPGFVVPDGFIEVTPELLDTPLSPRHTLGQFVPPEPSGWPKYIVLREDLILKLELLTDLIVEKGHACTRLEVMSGFRTPARQDARGGGRNSAHIYGGAADVYIDESGNGSLDDLNGDGKSDSQDARLLASYVDELEQRYPEFVGGVGWYRRTRARTAFVHVDTRGERMRWNQ
ncbi:MAG TPA: hypothetical protein ENN51_07400 [candidate division WOR-3 bacterium]|uniref:Peptidase M15A C-terminal domain-containing protein n=1 Tax=candidate division WOR-3 bacterium TaxID=2052148 RepID=A0A7V0XFI8_UNCW3|nr:hypothetical protein [candidate division WOR-3 bacterium]